MGAPSSLSFPLLPSFSLFLAKSPDLNLVFIGNPRPLPHAAIYPPFQPQQSKELHGMGIPSPGKVLAGPRVTFLEAERKPSGFLAGKQRGVD